MRAATRVNEAVVQVRGYGQAAGAWVKVEVTGEGTITNLSLAEQTRGMPAHELARAIREAQRAAITDAMQKVQQIQSQITENSYVTALLNRIGSAQPRNPQATITQGSELQQRASRGMTEQELDASQEEFSFDPLGRRQRR
ncbi:hypothetical protein MSTE_02014 [Mycobacteroides stephanolepidis]|uniref:DNA-binding protein n=2 Tax=[Mycobacterium] stephanolepidis TaxID=1520670 RepID=A0A1Z4EWK0_9MYCO|nr:hypothetical protein MSTE_02014 [[Mycobacterium] stephanolepidis]